MADSGSMKSVGWEPEKGNAQIFWQNVPSRTLKLIAESEDRNIIQSSPYSFYSFEVAFTNNEEYKYAQTSNCSNVQGF